ncbi:MAG: hypothetical protein AVDCRST_MAG13-3118, partial [uncultured Solirubrobacteraceae bacterium]
WRPCPSARSGAPPWPARACSSGRPGGWRRPSSASPGCTPRRRCRRSWPCGRACGTSRAGTCTRSCTPAGSSAGPRRGRRSTCTPPRTTRACARPCSPCSPPPCGRSAPAPRGGRPG